MSRSIIMGVDPGLSHVGVAVVRFSATTATVVGAWTLRVKGDDGERLDWIAGELWRVASEHEPDAVAVEDIASVEVAMQRVGRTNKKSRRGLEVLGMARLAAVARGVPCYEIAARTAKVSLAGHGDATKADMVTAAKRLFGVEVSEHGADAIAIAKAGRGRHNLATMRHAADSLHRRAHLGHR